MNFKSKFSIEHRKAESSRIKEKYPDRIPCIVSTRGNLSLEKYKYLIPKDLTVGSFLHVLRNRIKKVHHTAGMFLFLENGELPRTYSDIDQVYQDYHNEDGFLYFVLTIENTFGN